MLINSDLDFTCAIMIATGATGWNYEGKQLSLKAMFQNEFSTFNDIL